MARKRELEFPKTHPSGADSENIEKNNKTGLRRRLVYEQKHRAHQPLVLHEELKVKRYHDIKRAKLHHTPG